MNVRDADDASKALCRWLQSQDICPHAAIPILLLALGEIIYAHTDGRKEAAAQFAKISRTMKFAAVLLQTEE